MSNLEIFAIAIIVPLIAIVPIRVYLSSIERRVAVLSRIDAKLDLLLKQQAIEYDPYKDISFDVRDALQRGRKIEAIKRYRKEKGVGLKEAKDFIEQAQRRAGLP